MTIKNCRHHKLIGQCGYALCPHYSGFDENAPERYFGRYSDAAAAQHLFKTDRPKYDALRAIAVERRILWS
jgi:hypothetical protein